MDNSLDIALLHRPGTQAARGGRQRERQSIDFLVDGVSLFQLTTRGKRDMCGRFSADLSEKTNRASYKAFTLKGEPDTRSGRYMIFVCPECGDLGCGAITLRISRVEDRIVWSDFSFENGQRESVYDQPADLPDPEEIPAELVDYSTIGPFSFSPEQYRDVLWRATYA